MIVERVREALLRHRVGRFLLLMLDNLTEHAAPTAAGAMAFDAFLSLVPLVAFAGYLLHRMRENFEVVVRPMLQTAPAPVQQLVDAEFLRLSEGGAAIVAPVSIAAFLWVSSAGISTAMAVFETMFHSAERPWYIRRLIAMGAVIGAFFGWMIVLSVSLFLARWWGSIATAILAVVVPFLVVLGMICAFFRIAIRGPRPLRRRILPGALATLVLWAAASLLFSFYVATLSRYATLYGGLAAVAIFLFWLWLLALSILVGGEINAQLEGVRKDGPVSLRLRRAMPTMPDETITTPVSTRAEDPSDAA